MIDIIIYRIRKLRGSVAFLVVLSLWSVLSYIEIIDPIFLPTPTRVIAALVDLFQEHAFADDIIATTVRVLGGFTLASVTAITLGLFMANWTLVDQFNRPFLSFMRYIPVSGFVPLLILWAGIGFTQKVTLIFLGVFFHLALLVADDAARVPREILDTARLLQVSKLRMLTKVILPHSLPAILDDSRIMLGAAWTYIVLAELIAATSGIGNMMIQSQRFLLTDRVIAGILTVGVIGLLSDIGFRSIGRLMMPWTRV